MLGVSAAYQKSPEAFRTISEVAAELEVPQHVLRFWESKFSQVKPVKRGGGRRYYRPDDVDLLRGIRTLLYSEGFTIKGVQKVLREHGVRYVAEIGRGEGIVIRPLDAPPRPPLSLGEDEENPDDADIGAAPREGANGLDGLLDELLDMKRRLAAGRARLLALMG